MKKKDITFSVITPCFNSENLIEETIKSIVNQSVIEKKICKIEYWLIDGNSKDSTLEIIKNYKKKYHFINYISEPDKGMYDALAKGLKIITGEIVSYINAGDFYSPTAFETIYNIMSENNKVNWLTGLATTYNNNSEVIDVSLPYKYRRIYIQRGMYNEIKLPFIQQESTFWKSEFINEDIINQLSKFKLAGDYFLWYNFSKISELYIVSSYIGGFKIHENQLSSNLKSYYEEMNLFIHKKFTFYYFDLILWKVISKGLKKKISNMIFVYDTKQSKWVL